MTVSNATRWAVSVSRDQNANSHSLGAYRVSVSPTEDAATGRLATGRTVFNNTEHASGVFDSLEDAVSALAVEVTAPFTLWENDHTGELLVYSVDREWQRGDGLRRIVEAGGYAVVQDPATAEVRVMPQAAIAAVPGARVLPLEQIGRHLAGIHGRAAPGGLKAVS